MRTPDGRICVLDYGLMTEVSADQRMALVEYIAHLTTADWDNVVIDLQVRFEKHTFSLFEYFPEHFLSF